jgi:hypothetical protein
MKLTFVQLRTYVSDTRRLGLTDEDQQDLEQALLDRPDAGKAMQGTGGLRKIRHAPRRRAGGKSRGVRVCYAHFPRFCHVYFIVAFGKNEKENLTAAEKREIRSLLREIGEDLNRRQP